MGRARVQAGNAERFPSLFNPIAAAFAALSFTALFYVYAGYGLLLRALVALSSRGGAGAGDGDALPGITVLVTAFNEEAVIAKRLANLLSCDYPAERLQVLVASDGSTDGTDSIVLANADTRVRLFRPPSRGGKSATQNQAMALVTGDVVVFTDAATSFEPQFLKRIAAPFRAADVGAVDGHLLFLRDDGDLSASQGYYWKYELTLRELESRIGVLAVMSGACMAVRRNLLKPLPADVGEDCVVPLDVVEQGMRVVHASDALAYDRMEHTAASELRARKRMTLRNWKGTWLHSQLLNPLLHPGYAWALWSHKLLRWLSPFMLIIATLSCAWLAPTAWPFAAMSILLGVFYGLGLIGWWAARGGPAVPISGTVFSFLLANTGFLLGIVSAMRGTTVTQYTNAGKG